MEENFVPNLKRLQATLRHVEESAPPNCILQMNNCSSNEQVNKDQKTGELNQLTVTAIEYPDMVEVDSKVPNEVYLFPLYTRPIFPHVRISTVPRQLINPNAGVAQPTLDRIKKVLERLSSESPNGTQKPPSVPTVPMKQVKVIKAEPPLSGEPQSQASDTSETAKIRKFAYFKGPIVITDRSFIDTLVKLKNNGETHVVLCLAKSSSVAVTKLEDVYQVGVLASIEIADGGPNNKVTEVLLTGSHRVLIEALPGQAAKPLVTENSVYFKVRVKELKEQEYDKESPNNRALVMSIISSINELCKLNHPLFKDQLELLSYKIDQREPSALADLCASLTTASGFRLQQVLQELNVHERLKRVQLLLASEVEVCKLVLELRKTNPVGESSIPGAKMITGRGEKNSKVISEFKDRLKGLQLPEHAKKVIDEEMTKLGSLDPVYNATEHYTCRNYLNWLTQLPWGVYTKDSLDLPYAEKILEEDHYGLQDVKQRILEFIAVGALKGSMQGKILCFVGPPGTGKTSIGKSIARSLQRKFTRFSVGGMHDVAEIKGHRRTYIGAMPGKLIQSVKVTKSSNPVILIDEVDKLSRAWDGDPSAALLEVLDPEQNNSFLDHYLDVPFDLSKVLFICTANTLDTIPRPLLDRMEIIPLSGYFLDEKMQIARRHLLPKVNQDTNLSEKHVYIDDSALVKLIGLYCREAGVRNLAKHLEKIYRKVAMKVARGETQQIVITKDNLEEFVGKPRFSSDRLYEVAPPGVVTGLAWNAMGGSLIWIESVLVHHRKPALKTTGKLGKVMKESIEIAFTFAKKFISETDPTNVFFDTASLHIHFPEGATPKDGPSAGCAIVTSFLSLALNKPARPNLAMTGEITLTGKVLPVGGIKEKTMAAKRSNITYLLLPEQNRKDWEELPDGLKTGVTVHFVGHYRDVFNHAFNY